jgi:signal transduction histidine kinase
MRPPLSVRTYLIGLIAGVLLPLMALSGFLVLRAAEREQDTMAQTVKSRTRLAAAAIESELGSLRARLFLLGGGLSLETSDLVSFHARAKEAFGAMTVILSDPNGQEIVNTSMPYGDGLPENPDHATLRAVARSRRPKIGELVTDPVSHRPTIIIAVPVTRDSKLVYVLSLDIFSDLPRIIGDLDLPKGWVAAIFDRRGTMIGRDKNAERYVGTPAKPAFLRQILSEQVGWVRGRSREGVPTFASFAHIRDGDWTISVGIPRQILLAPVRRTTWSLILLGAAALTLAMVLGALISRRIGGPVVGLVPAAEALGRGDAPAAGTTALKEANIVALALNSAGEQLRAAAARQRAANAALRESEQRYRIVAGDLAQLDQERAALLNRTVITAENERKLIARELHDDFAQHLTTLRLKTSALRRVADERTGAMADDLLRSIGELGRAVHRMAWELRPVALDGLDFGGAVEHFLEEWSEIANLPVDVSIDLGGRTLPPAVETTLFRVLQEAATNVLRHANASQLAVVLEAKGTEVRLIVEDNGRGIPGGEAAAATTRFGLVGMRERLALVNGALMVESGPDQGTALFIRIPIARRQDAA